MSFWLRALLTWVLAVALPLQGVAAATMLHCSDDGLPATQSNRVSPAPIAGAMPMPASHHHHHETSSADAPKESGAQVASSKAKCSVCASCCVATALPAAIHDFDAKVASESFAPTLAQAAPVFLTGGPERPPRSSIG